MWLAAIDIYELSNLVVLYEDQNRCSLQRVFL
jgi:hypothetical protein